MDDTKVLIHVRFAPNGGVTEISERPQALAPQDWFNTLSARASGNDQPLSGGLTATTSVPHKLRGNLTGAAQFIENFKHRKTVVALMKAAFAAEVEPSTLQNPNRPG